MFWKWKKKKDEPKTEDAVLNNEVAEAGEEVPEAEAVEEVKKPEESFDTNFVVELEEGGEEISETFIEEAIVEEEEFIKEEALKQGAFKVAEEVFEAVEEEAEREQKVPDVLPETELKLEATEEENAQEEIAEEKQEKKGFFKSLFSGLDKTRKKIGDQIDNLINNYSKIDDDLYEELEEILISADVGMNSTLSIIEKLKDELVVRKVKDPAEVKLVLRDVMADFLVLDDGKFDLESPTVLLVIGVNGAGKTTTIGKLASKLKRQGRTVTVAAADTFRAAAIDQLKVWAERAGANFIAQSEGSDPSAVIFDALQSAKSKKTDVLICDTAGRLHNKVNLMNELNKMFRVIEREYPEARREVLLVLDATTGQNAINQAKQFSEAAGITALAVTKMDGTAKGGFVFSIASELKIPVRLIGVGEKIEDLQTFDALAFANAILNME